MANWTISAGTAGGSLHDDSTLSNHNLQVGLGYGSGDKPSFPYLLYDMAQTPSWIVIAATLYLPDHHYRSRSLLVTGLRKDQR